MVDEAYIVVGQDLVGLEWRLLEEKQLRRFHGEQYCCLRGVFRIAAKIRPPVLKEPSSFITTSTAAANPTRTALSFLLSPCIAR